MSSLCGFVLCACEDTTPLKFGGVVFFSLSLGNFSFFFFFGVIKHIHLRQLKLSHEISGTSVSK